MNRCCGCQAGWPFDEKFINVHVTTYPNGQREFVVCTRDRYKSLFVPTVTSSSGRP